MDGLNWGIIFPFPAVFRNTSTSMCMCVMGQGDSGELVVARFASPQRCTYVWDSRVKLC